MADEAGMWAEVLARALFPELPPAAAREALAALPGGPALAAAVARLAAFAAATPARERLALAALMAMGERGDLPPPATPLEAAFRARWQEIWAPALAAARDLPVPDDRLRAAMAAVRDRLIEILGGSPT